MKLKKVRATLYLTTYHGHVIRKRNFKELIQRQERVSYVCVLHINLFSLKKRDLNVQHRLTQIEFEPPRIT